MWNMLVRFSCLTETNFASYVPNYQPQCLIHVVLERDSEKGVRKTIKILKHGKSRV